MAQWLREDTAAVISFGPFVDMTDGVTYEVGLVSALDHASTGIMLSKNGGALTIRHATVTASTYDKRGHYLVTLDTTDTNTPGLMRVEFSEPATCLSVWQDYMVIPQTIYDSYCTASAGAIPKVVAGAAGGLFIAGTNAAVTVTGATALSGGVAVTGALTVSDGVAVTCSTAGRAAIKATGNAAGAGMELVAGSGNALTVGVANIGATTLGNTTIGTIGTGAVTKASETITAALTTGSIVNNGVTTLTGAVTMPAGLAANITGNITGTLATVTAVTNTVAANVTQIGGVVQSATDLKDFADTGYDPSSHKVQGVVLTDTTTTATTATNLTNAPTNGDLTATMKTSVQTAAAAANTAYDAATGTELAALDAVVDAGFAAAATVADVAAAILTEPTHPLANTVTGQVPIVLTGSEDPETGVTLYNWFRRAYAILCGKTDGQHTSTGHFRNQANTKNRATATTDANNNRTDVTFDDS